MKVNVVDKRGKVVGLHPKVAQVLVGKGTVRYAEDPSPLKAAEPVAVAEPVVVSEPAAEADEVADREETAGDASEDAEISPRTGLPKRQYRRRDLQAE